MHVLIIKQCTEILHRSSTSCAMLRCSLGSWALYLQSSALFLLCIFHLLSKKPFCGANLYEGLGTPILISFCLHVILHLFSRFKIVQTMVWLPTILTWCYKNWHKIQNYYFNLLKRKQAIWKLLIWRQKFSLLYFCEDAINEIIRSGRKTWLHLTVSSKLKFAAVLQDDKKIQVNCVSVTLIPQNENKKEFM